MSDTLALNCCILDQSTSFEITIKNSQTVDALKKVIVSEAKLTAAAHTLYLWKVLVKASPRKLISAEVILDPNQSLELEDSTDILSNVFSEPLTRRHLHIVVRVGEPEFDLNCSVLEGDGRVFSVKVPKSEKVDGLKDAIKKKMEPEFDHVAVIRMDLWEVQMASILVDRAGLPHLKSNIKELALEDEQPLLDKEILSTVFSEPLVQKHLHIVVRVPPLEPNLPREPEFDLNCSVLEGDGRVFSVKVPKSEKVDGLKDAIKKKMEPEFDHVAVIRMDLWEVQMASILVDRAGLPHLKSNIKELALEDEQPLLDTEILMTVISEPLVQKHLHIVIRVPPPEPTSCTFACYFPAENPLFIPIKIQPDAWVAELLEAIQLKLKSCGREVSLEDLRIFKADVPLEPAADLQSRALQWVHQQPDRQLSVTNNLSSVFPNGPRPSHDQLVDIIIADAEVLELAEGLADPDDTYKRKVKKALEECLNRLSFPSPSDVVNSPKEQAQLLGCDEPNIHLGRPGGAPAAIFNPVLATLQKRLDHLEEVPVSRPDVERAAKYLRCAVMFYDDESSRQKSIKGLVEEVIGEKGNWQLNLSWADNIKPDGSWWYDGFLYLALELKNTSGLSGDALLQAIMVYSKIVSREKFKCYREFCNFPVVLVGITANRLEISIAVCVGPIYVTKLLTLDLSLGFHASNNIIRLARVFQALSGCRADLKSYYDGVRNSNSLRLSCLYPNPTLVKPSEALPKLTYRKFLSRAGQPTSAFVDLGNATTTMYIATLGPTNQEVIVKFTAHYNKDAHSILAEAGLAPKLHFCERVVGDLFMVVMDRVDGKSIWQLQEDKIPVPPIVSKRVEDAVHLLHEKNIVFGDLRDPNILYIASENRVVLVDFDWAGTDEETRYPATLNPSNVWADDVSPFSIMRKTHDMWQLDRLKALCSPDA